MKKVTSSIFLAIIFLGFFSHFPVKISEVRAESLVLDYPSLHFYMDVEENKETTFEDANFYFDVTNPSTNIHSYNIVAGAEVFKLENWQEYFSFSFQEKNITTAPGETARFFPKVTAKTNLSFDYLIHFVFFPEILKEGNQIIGAAAATAIFSINADINASRLEIQLTDQSGKERSSYLEIKYNREGNYGYSPFKTFESIEYFLDVVPQGFYYIKARDLETNITEIMQFELVNNTLYQITYKIIAFLPFQILAPRQPTDDMIINYTVVNEYKSLQSVSIQVKVQKGNDTIEHTNNLINFFAKGRYEGSLNISNYIWQTGEYTITGNIYVFDSLYLHQVDILTLDMPIWKEAVNILFDLGPYILFGLLSFVSGIVLMKYNNKKPSYYQTFPNNTNTKTQKFENTKIEEIKIEQEEPVDL
jgi:hypothetical protein